MKYNVTNIISKNISNSMLKAIINKKLYTIIELTEFNESNL